MRAGSEEWRIPAARKIPLPSGYARRAACRCPSGYARVNLVVMRAREGWAPIGYARAYPGGYACRRAGLLVVMRCLRPSGYARGCQAAAATARGAIRRHLFLVNMRSRKCSALAFMRKFPAQYPCLGLTTLSQRLDGSRARHAFRPFVGMARTSETLWETSMPVSLNLTGSFSKTSLISAISRTKSRLKLSRRA